MLNGDPLLAFSYLNRGASLLMQPGLRRFIVLPLLVNVLISILTAISIINLFGGMLDNLTGWLPSWLAFVAWLIWGIIAFSILMIYGYSFNLITNLIAAPFYGILAGKIEESVTNVTLEDEVLTLLITRTLGREIVKLWYFITRGLLIALIIAVGFFIPGLNIVIVFIGLAWGAWSMAVQYADYPADNHQIPFRQLRRKLGKNALTSYSFGGFIMMGSMVPLVNIFIIPIAVAAATLYWIEELKTD